VINIGINPTARGVAAPTRNRMYDFEMFFIAIFFSGKTQQPLVGG